MLPRAEEIEQKLQEALAPSFVQVIDETAAHSGHEGAKVGGVEHGYGTHFRVRIASLKFTGLSRVAQHRLVYDATHCFIERGLHALAIEIQPVASQSQ
jgi:BolA family transcriptional regulator, general stress-responsive regulator